MVAIDRPKDEREETVDEEEEEEEDDDEKRSEKNVNEIEHIDTLPRSKQQQCIIYMEMHF